MTNPGARRYLCPAGFVLATIMQGVYFTNARLAGNVRFDGARVQQDLWLRGARLDPGARLSFRYIDLRLGGRIMLSIDQIGRTSQMRLLLDEDSKDPEELAIVATQYNLLRDNFRVQPSTDEEEDRCHYKYMDYRRRGSTAPRVENRWDPARWVWYWVRRFCNWAFLKRCYGYGVYPMRIVATMVLVILAFGAIYASVAGPESVKSYYDGPTLAQAVDDLCDRVCPLVHPPTWFSPWRLSLLTFVTISYGEYAPIGGLRWVAGLEGLLGLFLMALFTVSVARKVIR